MRHYFRLIATLLLLPLFPISAHASVLQDDPEMLLGLIQYIGNDYHNAVANGQIINQTEFDEMIAFVTDVKRLHQELASRYSASGTDRSEVEEGITRLAEMLNQHSSSTDVLKLTQDLEKWVLAAGLVTIIPEQPPNLAAGKLAFLRSCASCHGVDGNPQDGMVSAIIPPPAKLASPEVQQRLSPLRVYLVVTHGIDNSAMNSFRHLNDDERWQIAFYVASGFPVTVPEFVPLPVGLDLTPPFATTASNREWHQRLQASGMQNSQAALRYLAFSEEREMDALSGSLQNHLRVTRLRLLAATDELTMGRRERALDSVISAYLKGMQPAQYSARTQEPKLFLLVEQGFAETLNALRAAVPDPQVLVQLDHLIRLVIDLERHSSRAGISPIVAFVAAATMILREGFEAFLVIIAILAFLRQSGYRDERRAVHYGWISALLCGIILWFGSGLFLRINPAERELIDGTSSLIAAAILFVASYWLITIIEVEKWKEYIKTRIEYALSLGSAAGVFGVSFIGVFRETVESVVFFRALTLQAGPNDLFVIFGLVTGILLLFIFTFSIFNLGIQLQFNYFFGTTSGILYFLAIVLTGKGVRALQEAGLVSTHLISFPQIFVLGIYPTAETIFAQSLLLIALFFALLWVFVIGPDSQRRRLHRRIASLAHNLDHIVQAVSHIRTHIHQMEIELQEVDDKDEIRRVRVHMDELTEGLSNLLTGIHNIGLETDQRNQSLYAELVHGSGNGSNTQSRT